MKEEIGKRLLLNFEEHLKKNFKEYCERHSLENSTENFIIFLVDKNLVNAATIKRYTILNDYNNRFTNQEFSKSKTVETLADLYNLSTRHVWSILKYSHQLDSSRTKKISNKSH